MIRKRSSGVRRGGVGKVPIEGNSLASYSTKLAAKAATLRTEEEVGLEFIANEN